MHVVSGPTTGAIMIPYDDIIETADRRWTFRLLGRLASPDLPDDERDDLVEALQAVSDPRSFASLEAILCDTSRPARVREAAGDILRGMRYLAIDVPEDKLRHWWREGDTILRRHALLCMDRADCPDIILQLAADRGHELHAEALGQMDFFFDLPEHQGLKIAALAHPDPRVRATAAYVLLWDEPVVAEGPLIEATRDPVPEVAREAANTLEYYPSLKSVRCLHALLDHADEKVRAEARESYGAIRNELLDRLCARDQHVALHIRNWLRPVWEKLAFSDEELRRDEDEGPSPGRSGVREAMPVADLLVLLADPDASPRVLSDRLWDNNWQAYGVDERRRLRPVLLTHPDPLVRERAALCFEAWQDVPGLLGLVRDPDFLVRKSAMYHLGELPPTPGIAGLAWEHLQRPDTLGVHATETLATFVRHADPLVAVRRLGVIAGDHGRREALRVAAVDGLARLGAKEEVRQLAGLLREPPAVTWALHIALMEATAELGLPRPDIRHLAEVDNLHMQEAIA
jgi:HEAT repeat protein